MVKLVFIHLPKTGGSSILETLTHVYGAKRVRHFERDECLALNQQGRKISEVLENDVEVIHGHFHFKEIKDLVKRDKPKVVTFMRKPVDRVISNYKWWKHTLTLNQQHPEISRVDEPIEVYAKRPVTRNKMSQFLKGIRLSQLYFVGFLESFAQDFTALAKALNWPEAPIYHEKNRKESNQAFTLEVEAEVRKEIARLNKKDARLYQKAQRLFNKTRK